MMLSFRLLGILIVAMFGSGVATMTTISADEGMWLLNAPPKKLLQEKYQFKLEDAWLDRAMKANVRFNSGGSGSFVSPNGLVITNHHIAADALQKLSTSERDLFELGFLAKTQAEELRCPDLELNVLQSIEVVTDQVEAAVTLKMSATEASAARRTVLGAIEKESLAKTGLRSDVVTLYQGGAYHLYRYKKYTDVRLVFAPEQKIAAFGGDVDNFEYPRRSLDISFFRAYENDQPARTPDFFRWSKVAPKEKDLVFVTGHPGTTNRLETLAKLEHRRDVTLPYTLYRLRTMEAALTQYSEQSPEKRRKATTDLHRYANARKAYSGQILGLLDPKIMAQKAAEEAKLQKNINVQPWTTIAQVQKKFSTFEKEYSLVELGQAFPTDLFTIARHCVRMADELAKPSSDRLREYRDSNLESLKFQLFSPAPIEPDLERVKLQTALTFLAENLGGEHPVVTLVLAGKNPAQRAEELVAGCDLINIDTRKHYVNGGKQAIASSTDTMISLVKAIDEAARNLRKKFETEIEEPERQAFSEIAKIRFRVLGSDVAPDATFTLRMAFGTVQGYSVDGETLPFHTTIGGAFQRAEEMKNREPFDLPPSWLANKKSMNLETPFNFVSTADTIGGNSGSPVLNRDGELVGINFDRNRHGLVRNFVYTDVQARHIAVHAFAVLEALRSVYHAENILQEIAQSQK